MSDSLNEVRKHIDSLDNQILDLLMDRAELIREVSAIKRKSNKPIVHPAREAKMIRRLLGRHSGILPQAAVIGIWRELVGAVSMLQRGLKAYVSTEGEQTYCWDMAKDYCGSVIPMSRSEKSLMALSFARDNRDSVAIVPWPNDSEEKPWWLALVEQESFRARDDDMTHPMQVIVALPFGDQKPLPHLENKALMVGRMPFLSSDDDHSFIVIQVKETLSRARAIELLNEQGIEAVSILSHINADHSRTSHLVEVEGYVANDDEKLILMNEKLSGQNGNCMSIGGFPVPPMLRAGDTDPV